VHAVALCCVVVQPCSPCSAACCSVAEHVACRAATCAPRRVVVCAATSAAAPQRGRCAPRVRLQSLPATAAIAAAAATAACNSCNSSLQSSYICSNAGPTRSEGTAFEFAKGGGVVFRVRLNPPLLRLRLRCTNLRLPQQIRLQQLSATAATDVTAVACNRGSSVNFCNSCIRCLQEQ
jgi:hypothetical protein